MKIERPYMYFKRKKCRTQTFGLNVFQTVFNDDFHSLIFFEFKPGFGNFRNAWIQLNNFHGKLKKDENELFPRRQQ